MTQNEINNSLGQLVSRLQNEDSKYARLSKSFQIGYGIFALLLIYNIVWADNIYELIEGICNVLAFSIFAFFFRKMYKTYKYVDYSLSTIQMLKLAADRYRPFNKASIWVFISIILIDIGLTMSNIDDHTILSTQLIFWGMIIIATIIGLIRWYIKYKPIRDAALDLIAEIEGE